MTHEERKRFGKAVRDARMAKGWTLMQLVAAMMRFDSELMPSSATMSRLENGGLTPSEVAKGMGTTDTPTQERLRRAAALALEIAAPGNVAYIDLAPGVARAPAETPIEAPVAKAGEKKPAGIHAARKAGLASRVAIREGRERSIPKMVKFYTSLTTEHGFSVGAIRTTLRQLKALGISTESVRGEIKQQFAAYIDTLEV